MQKLEVIPKPQDNEGAELRSYIRRSGYTQDEFAASLSMTRQNLSYHMRKRKFDDDFRRLLKENGIDLASTHTKKMENNSNESDSDIPYNIPLKKSRMAKVILPKESKASDIDTIISHLKLMKDAMD